MIRVDRARVVAPAVLVDDDKAGKVEKADNKKLADAGNYGDMKFGAYKKDGVGDALDALFHRKCAYCESMLLGNQPGDVEHYRPKAKVVVILPDGRKQTIEDIYWWLAADWDNLLLSCADCNRPRTQDVLDGDARVVGKANLFPIADEALRAKSPEEVAAEPRLLLNPCLDDPEAHLTFNVDCTIEARRTAGGRSAMGTATIRDCGLHRAELLQARATMMRGVESAVRHVAAAFEQGRNPDPKDQADLEYFASPRYPFSAFAKAIIREGLAPVLAKLRGGAAR